MSLLPLSGLLAQPLSKFLKIHKFLCPSGETLLNFSGFQGHCQNFHAGHSDTAKLCKNSCDFEHHYLIIERCCLHTSITSASCQAGFINVLHLVAFSA